MATGRLHGPPPSLGDIHNAELDFRSTFVIYLRHIVVSRRGKGMI
jgi:hypothetical protein